MDLSPIRQLPAGKAAEYSPQYRRMRNPSWPHQGIAGPAHGRSWAEGPGSQGDVKRPGCVCCRSLGWMSRIV